MSSTSEHKSRSWVGSLLPSSMLTGSIHRGPGVFFCRGDFNAKENVKINTLIFTLKFKRFCQTFYLFVDKRAPGFRGECQNLCLFELKTEGFARRHHFLSSRVRLWPVWKSRGWIYQYICWCLSLHPFYWLEKNNKSNQSNESFNLILMFIWSHFVQRLMRKKRWFQLPSYGFAGASF